MDKFTFYKNIMKVSLTGLLVALLSIMPISTSFAEDDSCELKDDSQNALAEDKENEFTRDKTWHFKADNILHDEVDKSPNKKKDNPLKQTNASITKI